MTVEYRYPIPSLLVGCRIRFVVDGAAYDGRVLQVDTFVSKYANALVVRDDDGSVVIVRVTKLRVIELPRQPEQPYRGAP